MIQMNTSVSSSAFLQWSWILCSPVETSNPALYLSDPLLIQLLSRKHQLLPQERLLHGLITDFDAKGNTPEAEEVCTAPAAIYSSPGM